MDFAWLFVVRISMKIQQINHAFIVTLFAVDATDQVIQVAVSVQEPLPRWYITAS